MLRKHISEQVDVYVAVCDIQRLGDKSAGSDVLLVDSICHSPGAARHHPHLSRSADHVRHRQPQRTQTEGTHILSHIYLFIYLSVCLSIHLSGCLCVCLSICLICLFISLDTTENIGKHIKQLHKHVTRPAYISARQ